MAVKLLTDLKDFTLSGLETLSNIDLCFRPSKLTMNLIRVSIWGALGSGAAMLASSIFTRSIMQEGSWKALAPPVFKTSLTSCGIFTAVAAYLIYKCVTYPRDTDDIAPALNERVSLFAGCSAMIGLMGATAGALASKFLNPTSGINSFAKHSFYPLVGLGITGSILWLFHRRQKAPLYKD